MSAAFTLKASTVQKDIALALSNSELQPFREEKLSVEVNALLLVLSFQELDSQICLIFSYIFFMTAPTKSNIYFGRRRAVHCSFTAHPSTDDATLPVMSQYCTCPLSRATDAILYIKPCV